MFVASTLVERERHSVIRRRKTRAPATPVRRAQKELAWLDSIKKPVLPWDARCFPGQQRRSEESRCSEQTTLKPKRPEQKTLEQQTRE